MQYYGWNTGQRNSNKQGNHDTKTWEAAHRSHLVQAYQPSINSKILEKPLLHRLLSDPHSQDWIPSHQFGFRKAHSTIQQCHRLTNIINKTLEDHQYCSAVFLDISQAFDKVWHQGLLLKLQQTLPPNYFSILNTTFNHVNLQSHTTIAPHNQSICFPEYHKVAYWDPSYIHSTRLTSLNPQIQP